MSSPIESQSLREHALAYFRRRCKSRSQHRVGMEVEHICVRTIDGRRIEYDSGDGCVLTLLHELHAELGGDRVFHEERQFGLEGDWGKVTLEPGNQIEWSSPARASIHELTADLDHWLCRFNAVLRNNGVMTVSSGLDATGIRRVPWVPKRRYDIMRDYYRRNARVSHRAMLNTAGIHVSFDYADERDWQRRFRALTLASPAAIALFANSPGKYRGESYVALRPVLWLDMDDVRSSLPSQAFASDFSLEDWAAWVVSRPKLLQTTDGTLHTGADRPLNENIHLQEDVEAAWELQMSTMFPPVRTHGQLEVRTIDTQPDQQLAAVPAFWTGLIADDTTLSSVLDCLAWIEDETAWRNLLYRACRFGTLDAEIRQMADALLNLARHGLAATEGSSSRGLTALEMSNLRSHHDARLFAP